MFPFYFFKRWPHLGCFLEIQLKLWWPYQLSTNLWWLWHPSLVSLASVLSFPWRVLFWTKSGPFYALYAALKKEAIPPKKKLEPVLKGVVGRRSRISWVNKEVKLLHQKQFLKVKKKKKIRQLVISFVRQYDVISFVRQHEDWVSPHSVEKFLCCYVDSLVFLGYRVWQWRFWISGEWCSLSHMVSDLLFPPSAPTSGRMLGLLLCFDSKSGHIKSILKWPINLYPV